MSVMSSVRRIGRVCFGPVRTNSLIRRNRRLLGKVKATGIVFLLPRYLGCFEIARSNAMALRFQMGGYEDDSIILIEDFLDRDKDCIDVGANIGLYSVFLAKSIKGKVLAVEPTPGALRLLKLNLLRNEVGNCEIFCGVAGNEEGELTFHLIEGAEEYSSIRPIAHPNAPRDRAQAVSVRSMPLDRLVEDFHLRPGFIKIDVEGAEGLVLEGAVNCLKKFRPVVLCEVDDRLLKSYARNSRDIIRFLKDLGYFVFNADSGERLDDIGGTFIGNAIALPAERAQGGNLKLADLGRSPRVRVGHCS